MFLILKNVAASLTCDWMLFIFYGCGKMCLDLFWVWGDGDVLQFLASQPLDFTQETVRPTFEFSNRVHLQPIRKYTT